MISLIDVECPHCGTHGQIVVPPVGSIIIGPCPKCTEMVVVFCGQVLALDKSRMRSEDVSDRQEHLLEVLTDFLGSRISTLLTEDFIPVDSPEMNSSEFEEFGLDEDTPDAIDILPEIESDEHITESEVEQFMDVDLKLLDNRAYFNSVFGEK
jgi:hypothetical protein